MKHFQHQDLLKHYMALINLTIANRIKELWLVENIHLKDLYKIMIKEFPILEVYIPSFPKHEVKHKFTEGSTLVFTAMIFLDEADKATVWNKYKNSFEEKQKADNMTLGEYHEMLRLQSVA